MKRRHRGKFDFVFLCSLVGGRVNLLAPEAGLLTELLLKYPLLPRGDGGATGTVRLRLSKQ